MNNVLRNIRNMIVVAGVLSGVAFPAFAEDLTAIVDSAVNAFNRGVDDEAAGSYPSACIAYRDAARRFESAIYSLAGMPMGTDEERDNVKAYADHLQKNVDAAKAGASRVCGK